MFFAFPYAARHAFTMQGVPMSLDMVFIGPGLRVVALVSGAAADSIQPLVPSQDAQYVLEVPAGWIAAHGTQMGDKVSLVNLALSPV